jgi:hypothetical protein
VANPIRCSTHVAYELRGGDRLTDRRHYFVAVSELRSLAVPDTTPLFAPLRAALLSLLRALEPSDLDRPTVAGAWRVRDVAAHLLDGEVRVLVAHRDGHTLPAGGEIRSYDDVVALIQRLNAEGAAAGRHLSARLLTDLLAVTGEWRARSVMV